MIDFSFMRLYSETVLAIDIGTSGVRAALITSNGLAVSSAQALYGFHRDDRTGVAEMDAELVFNRVLTVINRCTSGQHNSFVHCVSVASAMHSLVLLDETGRPLTPLSIWMDARAKTQCEQYRGIYERSHWHQKTGCILSPSVPLARLLWYRDREPELFRRFSKAISIKAYVLMRLLGVCVEDHSVAAGSGLLNIMVREWETEVLDYLGLDPVRLPELVDSQDVIYRGIPAIPAGIEIDGVGPDTVWIAGGADGLLAHKASVGKSANTGSLTIGTSAAARRSSVDSRAERDKTVWCYPFDMHSYVIGQASNNGGAVIDWCLRTFFPAGTLLGDLDGALRYRRPEPELFFIPFLHTERDCLVVQRPTAGLIGLRPKHDHFDLLQAVMEGVLFHSIEMMERIGSNGLASSVVVSGGIVKLNTAQCILSAIIPGAGRLSDGVDATLRGAAILGWEYLGVGQVGCTGGLPLEASPHSEAYLQNYRIWKEKTTGSLLAAGE